MGHLIHGAAHLVGQVPPELSLRRRHVLVHQVSQRRQQGHGAGVTARQPTGRQTQQERHQRRVDTARHTADIQSDRRSRSGTSAGWTLPDTPQTYRVSCQTHRRHTESDRPTERRSRSGTSAGWTLPDTPQTYRVSCQTHRRHTESDRPTERRSRSGTSAGCLPDTPQTYRVSCQTHRRHTESDRPAERRSRSGTSAGWTLPDTPQTYRVRQTGRHTVAGNCRQ